jgi:hypothetical protein
MTTAIPMKNRLSYRRRTSTCPVLNPIGERLAP